MGLRCDIGKNPLLAQRLRMGLVRKAPAASRRLAKWMESRILSYEDLASP